MRQKTGRIIAAGMTKEVIFNLGEVNETARFSLRCSEA